ncbi:MAG: hypothetical protein HYS78_02410 [Parcubacteria group bacterium]|nr:hypothetical protein [Parcubacteria group bacterium]
MDEGYLGIEDFTVQRIADIITGFACWLIGVVLVIMVIALIISGIRFFRATSFVTDGGKTTEINTAKKNLQWVLVGILVILATNVIIATIANALGRDYSFIPLNCGFALPPSDSVTCSPKSQSVKQGEVVSFSASKGKGSYFWSAPGGSSLSGSDSNFITSYSTTGTKTVTVTSIDKSAACTVNVSSSEAKTPAITSFTPDTTTAGVKISFNQDTGIVQYGDKLSSMEITGENLDGAVLAAVDSSIDPTKAGIEFRNIKVENGGKTVKAEMVAHPWAKDGGIKINLTNKSGRFASFNVKVDITGTQYLQRRFKDKNVKFFGDWPNLMPDGTTLLIETNINKGLQQINKPNYRKLGIITHIYESNYWDDFAGLKACGDSGFGQAPGGCAPFDSNITISKASLVLFNWGNMTHSRPFLERGILHETAHQLHLFYAGRKPWNINTSNFENEWRNALGDLRTCPFLPLRDDLTWADGSTGPRCGFIWNYGALWLGKGEGTFYEDVALFEEFSHFGIKDNIPKDDSPRYQQKLDLLRKYGF